MFVILKIDHSMPATPVWIPQMGMKFSSVDEAWEFWVTYGGRMGFDVGNVTQTRVVLMDW